MRTQLRGQFASSLLLLNILADFRGAYLKNLVYPGNYF